MGATQLLLMVTPTNLEMTLNPKKVRWEAVNGSEKEEPFGNKLATTPCQVQILILLLEVPRPKETREAGRSRQENAFFWNPVVARAQEAKGQIFSHIIR